MRDHFEGHTEGGQMRHRTPEDVREDLEALGFNIGSEKLVRAITAMLNNPAFPPKKKMDPMQDCVVVWADDYRPW